MWPQVPLRSVIGVSIYIGAFVFLESSAVGLVTHANYRHRETVKFPWRRLHYELVTTHRARTLESFPSRYPLASVQLTGRSVTSLLVIRQALMTAQTLISAWCILLPYSYWTYLRQWNKRSVHVILYFFLFPHKSKVSLHVFFFILLIMYWYTCWWALTGNTYYVLLSKCLMYMIYWVNPHKLWCRCYYYPRFTETKSCGAEWLSNLLKISQQ